MIATIEVCSSPVKLIKAIREAVKWYKAHLTSTLRASRTKVPDVVLLSNDQGNLDNAKAQGIACISSYPFEVPYL